MDDLVLSVLDRINGVLDHLLNMLGVEVILEVAEETVSLSFHARGLVCYRLSGGLC